MTIDLDALAEKLFAAFTAHDYDAVGEMVAPDVIFTQNGTAAGWAKARPFYEGLRAVVGDHRYENVRRVIGDRAVVEEHDVVSTTPAGKDICLPACVVIRVDDDGRITAIDEYVDPTPLM